jgi:hypothetical protein
LCQDAEIAHRVQQEIDRRGSAMPEHRRIDQDKVTLRCANRHGVISLTVTAVNGDLE